MRWTQERCEAALKRMARPVRSPFADTIERFEPRHRRWALAKFGKGFQYFEDGFDVLANVIRNANRANKSAWPKHRIIQFYFAGDSLARLFRAKEDALDGFGDEAIVLTRSVYEAFMRIVFISCFPRDWEATLPYEPTQRPKRAFKVTTFLRDELKVDWDFPIYQQQSVSAHGQWKTILRLLGKGDSVVGLKLKCDPSATAFALNSLTFCLWTLYHVSKILFWELSPPSMLAPTAEELMAATDEGLEGLVALTFGKKGRTATEVLKIGRIVRAAEQGKHWRSLV